MPRRAAALVLLSCATDARKLRRWRLMLANQTGGPSRRDGRPVPDPIPSWWLNGAPLQNVTGALPSDADVVIVGAGITGASVARHLAHLSPRRAARTLVVDARGAAGGATGRNGGQCDPQDCEDFEDMVDDHGIDEALAERAYQFANVELMREYVERRRGASADIRFGGYAIGWLTSRDRSWGESAVAMCRRHADRCGDPYCASIEQLSAAEAEARLKSPHMLGATYKGSGGGMWSAKVAFALLDDALERGVTLRTQTMVASVDRDGDRWLVRTDRGDVRAAHVVFATNGYTSALVPDFAGKISAWKNQVVITRPAPPLWDFGTWLNSPPGGGSAYIMQRADGRVVIGGAAGGGDRWDDSTVSDAVTAKLLGDLTALYPELAGVEVEQTWVGVGASSTDGFAWVGPVPTMPGCYVAAGFGGEGMTRAFAAGRAVAQMLSGHAADPLNPRYLPTAGNRRW